MGKICSLGYGFMKNVVCGEFADPDRKEMIMEGKQDNLLLLVRRKAFSLSKRISRTSDDDDVERCMLWVGHSRIVHDSFENYEWDACKLRVLERQGDR